MEFLDIEKFEKIDVHQMLDSNDSTNNVVEFPLITDQFLSVLATNEMMNLDQGPPHQPHGPPKRGNFHGDAKFEISIDGLHTKKRKFLYSMKLNRIYVDMGCNFPLQFHWDSTRYREEMYVRATVVFSDPDQAQKKVEACYQHSRDPKTNQMNSVTGRNVLRSGRELNVPGVHYCGYDDADTWYSVVVAGAEPFGHPYQFVCKNSCSSGINRRSIEIVFTLEDSLGRVVGQQSLGARVCSCPRRDIGRDEAELEPPRAPPAGKKRRLAPDHHPHHDRLVALPAISVVGTRAAISGLRVMLDMQEQALAIKTANHQPVDDLNRSITELRKSIEELESD